MSNSSESRARMLRILAKRHRLRAAELDMEAAAIETGASVRRLVDLVTEAEAREVAEHPDLAELNMQLEGFYDVGPVRPDEEPT